MNAGAGAAARAAVGGALAALRRRPRHVVLGALVAGLLAVELEPRMVVLLALAAAALAGRPGVAVLAAAAVLAGAIGGQARLAALQRSDLPLAFGTTATATVTLLEQPRPVRFGMTALAQLHGWPAPAGGGSDARAAVGADPARGGAASGGEGSAAGGAAATRPRGVGARVMLRIRQAAPWPPAPTGAFVRVAGRLRALGPFERHYARRGAVAAITVDAAAPTGGARGGLGGLVDAVRGRAERALAVGLPAPQAALLRGMALGQDEALPERTRDDFRASGLAHLTAASGQNVALLLALALPVLAFAGLGLRGRLVGALALIALYVPLAGAGQPASRWYALLLAAAATLAWQPRAAADPGWQLSFAAVVAIALATAPASARLRRRGVPRPVADAAAMTLAATVGTAPLLAFHFEQVSLASLPANLLAAPAVAPIMWLGMLAAALGQLATELARPLNALNLLLLAYVGAVAEGAAALPHAQVRVAVPGPHALAAAYAALGLLAAALRRGRRAR